MLRSACTLAILSHLAELTWAGSPLFGSITQKVSTAQKASTAPSSPVMSNDIGGLSEPASEIVSGTIDAFLGRSDISWSERQCLSDGASQFASSLTEACDEAFTSYKQFASPPAPPVATVYQPPAAWLVPTTPLPLAGSPMQDFAAASGTTLQPLATFESPATGAVPPAAAAAARRLQVSQGEEAVLSMEFLASLSNLYKTQSHIAKSCLKEDVVKELQEVTDHMTNITYIGERLVGNGMDIISETSNAFTSYGHGNYRAFGKDMGTIWRKVLISKPDEVSFRAPSTEAIEEATDGLFSSLLGRGFNLQITSDNFAQSTPAMPNFAQATPQRAPLAASPAFSILPTTMPSLIAPTTVNPPEVDVDLHACLVENMPLWKSAWTPVFEFVSSAASISNAEKLNTPDLMSSFMDIQLALQRCDISPTTEAMLIDTFESGGKFKAKLDVPDSQVHADAVPSLLSSALEDFKERNWHAFGAQLGKAMQQAVVVSFPQEYEVDDTGRLHKIVMEAAELGQTNTVWKSGSSIAALFGLVPVLFSALILLVAIRSRMSVLRMTRMSTQDYDLEAVE